MTIRLLLKCFAAFLAVAVSASAPCALAQSGAKPEQAALGDNIPSKWFLKAKGYEEALDLQKQTGADIFIYFTRDAPASEKGLCKWFENKALSDVKLRRFLRDYIKVHVPLPSNPESQNLAEQFRVGKTPAIYIVQPNRYPQSVKVFDWSEGRPKLDPVETIIETCRVRSSARYQLPSAEQPPPQP
jgi:hypothetical protein